MDKLMAEDINLEDYDKEFLEEIGLKEIHQGCYKIGSDNIYTGFMGAKAYIAVYLNTVM